MSMIKKPILTLAALSIAAFASITANAQQLSRTSLPYETYYTPEARNYLAPSLIPLKFDGRFEVWYLLGEPVINCTARWTNNHQLSVNTPGGDTIIAQPGDAEIYNLMLVAQLWDPERDKKNYGDKGGHIAAFCDAGIVAQSGQNGFNVAGSPNWDKFLCNLPSKFSKRSASPFAAEIKQGDLCEEAGGTWFSAEAAKKMARAGLKFEDVTIKSLEVNAGDAIRRHEKAQWRDKSFAYKESKANAIGQRLKQKDPFSTVAGTQVSQMRQKKGANPATPALLKDYDSTLSSLQNMLQDSGAFTAEWREKDEQLVREQLVHIRAIEPNILREEAKLTEYRAALERKAQNEPDGPKDPFAAYRTATLVPFTENGKCGFKRPNGSVAIPAHYVVAINNRGQECGRPIRDNVALYPLLKVDSLRDSSSLLSIFDNEGNAVLRDVNLRHYYYETLHIRHLTPYDEDILLKIPNDYNSELLFSLKHKRIVAGPNSGGIWGRLWLRNGRTAIAFLKDDDSCRRFRSETRIYSQRVRYFYPDSNRFEEDTCIDPNDDPASTKLK